MENVKRFHLTPHSARRLSDREISAEEMKDAVKYHDEKHPMGPGENGGKKYKFAKKTNGRTLVVIAELKKGECWLITTFYE
jgi:hypothetical protein